MTRVPLSQSEITEIWRSRAATKTEFQALFGVPAQRLISWEAGSRMSAAEHTLMLVIKHEPDAVRRAVKRLAGLMMEPAE